MYVNFPVSNIIVSAKYEAWIFFLLFNEIQIKFIKPLILISLSYFAGRTGREIGIDQPDVPEVKLDNPSLFIAHRMTSTVLHLVRFYFREYCRPTVAFFLCAEPIVGISESGYFSMRHIIFFCFGFLNT